MTAPPAIQIAIAVVEDEDRFLIGRRPPGGVLAGFWEFPGGKVDEGEIPADAAVRECREESGIQVRVARQFPDRIHSYDHGTVHLNFFYCRPLPSSGLKPRAPFIWVARGELATYEFPAGNAVVLEHLLSRI